jgi:hypothetical protein
MDDPVSLTLVALVTLDVVDKPTSAVLESTDKPSTTGVTVIIAVSDESKRLVDASSEFPPAITAVDTTQVNTAKGKKISFSLYVVPKLLIQGYRSNTKPPNLLQLMAKVNSRKSYIEVWHEVNYSLLSNIKSSQRRFEFTQSRVPSPQAYAPVKTLFFGRLPVCVYRDVLFPILMRTSNSNSHFTDLAKKLHLTFSLTNCQH